MNEGLKVWKVWDTVKRWLDSTWDPEEAEDCGKGKSSGCRWAVEASSSFREEQGGERGERGSSTLEQGNITSL